jgi:hypothetical protein
MVLLAAAMIAVMAASPAWAVPGNGKGVGQGVGGGDAAHVDPGNHTATGGGRANSPHLGCATC